MLAPCRSRPNDIVSTNMSTEPPVKSFVPLQFPLELPLLDMSPMVQKRIRLLSPPEPRK